ncbi:hypothetical protein [Pseudonocardia sp. ICBG1293]|uniref:hypothetical protein n=1 Tax=Pseudonocardia sp. ICBG1293 TaxID=2844382 RepID=UPI001CC9F070|nr:hypothetical protein [Pseudonocardia sp. ICBG1293]
MRMQFGPDSDDEFHAAAQELLDGFAGWLTENEVVAEPMSAELLLQYKWLAGDGDLADWPLEHVETFLDGWCPHVVLEHRLPVRLVPASVAAFVEYLDERGLLAPGSPRPSQVRRLCGEYVEEYDELEAGAGSPLLTELGDDPDPVRIPSPADRAASAAQARILSDARALAAWCGPRGRALTATGNLRLADARELVDLLGTGDEPDRVGRLDRATRLRTLTWVLEASARAGAVRREAGRLVAVPRFTGLDDTSAHEDLVLAARDVGALSTGWPHGPAEDPADPDRPDRDATPALVEDAVPGVDAVFTGEIDDQAIEELLRAGEGPPSEDATPALLFLLRHVDDGVDLRHALDVLLDWSEDAAGDADVASLRTAVLLEQLERLGVVAWTGSRREPDGAGGVRVGGIVQLTPGGVACALLLLAAEDLHYPTRPDPAVASAAEIVELAGEVPPDEWRRDIDAWHAAQPDPARAVSDFVAAALAPGQPLLVALTATGVAADRFGAEAVDALLREHLDGPHRGMVARRLVARGELDADAVEPELLLLASVDVLAVALDTVEAQDWPDAFAAEFPPETVEVFDALWRLDHPRVGEVLAALGEHHPDALVAKAARRARERWRSRTGGS